MSVPGQPPLFPPIGYQAPRDYLREQAGYEAARAIHGATQPPYPPAVAAQIHEQQEAEREARDEAKRQEHIRMTADSERRQAAAYGTLVRLGHPGAIPIKVEWAPDGGVGSMTTGWPMAEHRVELGYGKEVMEYADEQTFLTTDGSELRLRRQNHCLRVPPEVATRAKAAAREYWVSNTLARVEAFAYVAENDPSVLKRYADKHFARVDNSVASNRFSRMRPRKFKKIMRWKNQRRNLDHIERRYPFLTAEGWRP